MDAIHESRTVEPAKLVLELHARPGAEGRFEGWVKDLVAAAAESPALQGSSVLSALGGGTIILLRFASQDELADWRSSPRVAELLRAGELYATAHDAPFVQTGLETWFKLPGHAPPAARPPKWKMALVTWLALLPQVIALSFIVPEGTPFIVAVSVSTAIPVAMLSWVVMPRLTKHLARWLYTGAAGM